MLGFQFIQYENSTGKAVDLLTDERWAVCDKVQKPLGQNIAGILREIKLLSATRAPAHHERIVKDQVDIDTSATNTKMALLNEDDDLAKDCGVIMDMALVEPNGDNHVTLVVCNNADHPFFL